MISKTKQNLHTNLYVITGGPGVGKTTLLQALHQSGFNMVAEDARRIIQEEVASGGDGLPWKNKELYASLMLRASIDTYQKAMTNYSEQVTFFDRGIIDTLCYMDMEKISLSNNLDRIVSECRYNTKVFILPSWKEIYQKDSDRRQSWQEAEYTFHHMKQTYEKYGYELVQVPASDVDARVRFVVDQIGHFYLDDINPYVSLEVPVGLINNETLTNFLKYQFPGGANVETGIALQTNLDGSKANSDV